MATSVPAASLKLFKPLLPIAQGVGSALLQRRDALGTGDLWALEAAGIPSFEPLVDGRSYFNYHHTAADTLDKVDPENLRRQVAVMSLYAWFLAEMPQAPGRVMPLPD